VVERRKEEEFVYEERWAAFEWWELIAC